MIALCKNTCKKRCVAPVCNDGNNLHAVTIAPAYRQTDIQSIPYNFGM